jgi:L-threonylcarbamoyladenylate synthase
VRAAILPLGPDAYDRAARLLNAGELVALPTETVYGLAADARSDAAIASIYEVKGRPSFNPLITHLLDPSTAPSYARLSDTAERLIQSFWPGPLTLVLPRIESNLALRAFAGLDTIALRCPDTPWRNGLKAAGWNSPLVMPSANLSGHVSPTTADHVATDLGDLIDLIIDGGACQRGVESTVLRIDQDQTTLLRSGAIDEDRLRSVVPDLIDVDPEAPIASPGMLSRHYAPEAPLRLNARAAKAGETLIGFGPEYGSPNLSPSGDLQEAARNLYALLRRLDGSDVKLSIAPIPETGLGKAINDRLRRAARGR